MRRHFKRTALSAPALAAAPPPVAEAKGEKRLETVIRSQGITWCATRPRYTLSTRYSH